MTNPKALPPRLYNHAIPPSDGFVESYVSDTATRDCPDAVVTTYVSLEEVEPLLDLITKLSLPELSQEKLIELSDWRYDGDNHGDSLDCGYTRAETQVALKCREALSQWQEGSLEKKECEHVSYMSERGLPYCKLCHARLVTNG